MELNETNLEMIAIEAFIRRASKIDYPFMLKGSYVTRQYFKTATDRVPADLDWICLDKQSESSAKRNFNEWVTLITETKLDDNVTFRSFKENEFWRMIDYAMSDDFPTVNTDIMCWVGDKKIEFYLDISFNLKIDQPPVPLLYKPIVGKEFVVTKTVPLCLQVAWKIHQTLVRPRFKDLFDLMHLVQHNDFNAETLELSLEALLDECKADNVDLNRLKHFLNYDLEKLYSDNSMPETWDYWRHNKREKSYSESNILDYGQLDYITVKNKLPNDLKTFIAKFKEIMEKNGWKTELYNTIEFERKMNLWDRIKNYLK